MASTNLSPPPPSLHHPAPRCLRRASCHKLCTGLSQHVGLLAVVPASSHRLLSRTVYYSTYKLSPFLHRLLACTETSIDRALASAAAAIALAAVGLVLQAGGLETPGQVMFMAVLRPACGY